MGHNIVTTRGTARYSIGIAQSAADLRAAQRLRFQRFCDAGHASADWLDHDVFDDRCQHVVIHDRALGRLVCCFRIMFLVHSTDVARCYSAQFFDLCALQNPRRQIGELGRICVAPGASDPDILRLAWAEIARLVQIHRVEMLIGCTSFAGTDAEAHATAFGWLFDHALAPARWMPGPKSANVVSFKAGKRRRGAARVAQLGLPPLLRSYLLMGGRVSDHAVVDQGLGTLLVFTGLEIAALPGARLARLRRAAARLGS